MGLAGLHELVVFPEAIIKVMNILHPDVLVNLPDVLCGHLGETHSYCMILVLCEDGHRRLCINLQRQWRTADGSCF